MFSKSTAFYDRIYGSFKNYEQECRDIHLWLEKEHTSAGTILDVACGTGEHARLLHKLFGYEVDGIDLDPGLIALAREKNPAGMFCQGDMTDCTLKKSYDVVMCLFSSIGYVKTLERVVATLQRFKEHLKDDGIIIVEPWFQPGILTPGKIFLNTVEEDDLSIVRMSYNRIEGRISTLHFEYLIGTPGKIEHEIETHELGLFTSEEMMECFNRVHLQVRYDEQGLSGRGLYIARKRG